MSASKQNGIFSFFVKKTAPETEEFRENFFYEQIATLVGAGGWRVDFLNKKSYFDKQLQKILETPDSYKPSLKHALHFFEMNFHETIINSYHNLASGTPIFDEVIKMVTYTNKTFWAHAISKPDIDNNGEIVGLKGVVVNVNKEKERELMLEKAIDLVEANNSRLFTFANYVSHNIKSHVNNLELTSQLVETQKFTEDQKELFNNFNEIAKSLNRTVSRLNEVVSIQTKASLPKITIDLEETLEEIKTQLRPLIEQEEAYIYTDFSEVPEIEYNQEFLNNIFTILIKNGILNKSPSRKPEIKAYCIENDKKISLIIEDNGKGYDLSDRNADQIFHMSRSTDNNENNQSVGLFIVKNQVEALGGKIEVKSKLGYGTKFIITI
ncbi:HAMP domain-containing sensor histidine kinase [Leeuwenhoekiella aequorea]|uniref:sensor histidine kinase n=1 Tax=Leeuwenhoekiella aequorea TaxID=283736 RepID=UPI00352DE0CC